jgi:hypothetical protein
MEKFDTDLSTLHPILTECRVIKSDLELAVIQYANDISSEAHIEVQYSYQLLYFHMSHDQIMATQFPACYYSPTCQTSLAEIQWRELSFARTGLGLAILCLTE